MQVINNAIEASQKLDKEIELLENLVRDLKQIRRGTFPGKRTLAAAPLIDNWRVITRPTACLTGEFSGHPILKDTPTGITSDVWVISPQMGFVRTLSRYYKLGRKANMTDWSQ